LSFVEFNKQ